MCIYVYKYERSADKRNRCVALSLFSWHWSWILSGCMPNKAQIYPSLSSHTILLPALCPVQLEGFTFQTMWAAPVKEPWFSSTWAWPNTHRLCWGSRGHGDRSTKLCPCQLAAQDLTCNAAAAALQGCRDPSDTLEAECPGVKTPYLSSRYIF